ncbi:Zinc Finger Protein 16 [Manis pentadactyla]|nr:Zinc Finger Protein 16 [Manis pentadactyla]
MWETFREEAGEAQKLKQRRPRFTLDILTDVTLKQILRTKVARVEKSRRLPEVSERTWGIPEARQDTAGWMPRTPQACNVDPTWV